jgi:hypothetical protein
LSGYFTGPVYADVFDGNRFRSGNGGEVQNLADV